FMIKKLYKPRFIDEILSERLRQSGAVLIQGPKGSGKSIPRFEIMSSTLLMKDKIKDNSF
ncbi:MAG: hypothetical protein PHU15_07060, partial [Sphaerochaetaceae bacterium]|nr:hypothetical protein [Sphaerochaetaceae bacterium]